MITPRPHVAEIAPYALADLSVPQGVRAIELAQNESPYPPSPRAIQAAAAAASGARLYPDPDWRDLRTAIAARHGLAPHAILCGAGSMELIGALIRSYAGPGDKVLAPQHAYAFFQTATRLAGAAYVTAPETNLTACPDALLAAVTPKTRIVCLANPANPTGTWLAPDRVRQLRRDLPGDVLLLLDEAYAEFAPQDGLFDLIERGDTVITRTFSKAYGLAGMRVGWAAAPAAIADQLRKVLNPNNVNLPAQAAASAAIADHAQMTDTVARIAALRERFADQVRALGLTVPASHANFVLIRFQDAAQAADADRALRAQGIVLRAMGGHGLADCLRATIGTEDDMTAAATALTRWRQGSHKGEGQ
ncbi:MAG: histidinol-phosphate transaminase [Pseudomonadota bacterium]